MGVAVTQSREEDQVLKVPFSWFPGSGMVRVSGSAPWAPRFPSSLSCPLRGTQPRW